MTTVSRGTPTRVGLLVGRSASERRRAGSGPHTPLLVGSAVAGPEDDLCAVGGGGPGGIAAQPGLHSGDRAVGVDVPLLVGLTVAVPDDDRGTVGGSPGRGVEALVPVHHQLL